MLHFKVKEFRSRTGAEIVLLLNRHGQPAFWPHVFVTSEYVVAGLAANTQVQVLRSVGMAHMWAASEFRDLDKELVDGSILSADDISRLSGFLALNARSQLLRFEENGSAKHSKKTLVKLGVFDRIQEIWRRKKSNHQALKK